MKQLSQNLRSPYPKEARSMSILFSSPTSKKRVPWVITGWFASSLVGQVQITKSRRPPEV